MKASLARPRLDGRSEGSRSEPEPRQPSLANRIFAIFKEVGPPMTVRQVFYACVVRELVRNNKSAYRRVQRVLKISARIGS